MYGDPFIALRYKLINMPVDDLKEIPISLTNADVVGAHDMYRPNNMQKGDRLLQDEEGEIDGQQQDWVAWRCIQAFVDFTFKDEAKENVRKRTICAIGFKSADKFPNRDPTSVSISAM